MKIEKIPEGYLLAKKGGNSCELWRKFNGAESFACEAIDELIAERDALRAKIAEMERQEPFAWTTKLALELGSSALGFDVCRGNLWGEKGVPLYTLPGAKGEDK